MAIIWPTPKRQPLKCEQKWQIWHKTNGRIWSAIFVLRFRCRRDEVHERENACSRWQTRQKYVSYFPVCECSCGCIGKHSRLDAIHVSNTHTSNIRCVLRSRTTHTNDRNYLHFILLNTSFAVRNYISPATLSSCRCTSRNWLNHSVAVAAHPCVCVLCCACNRFLFCFPHQFGWNWMFQDVCCRQQHQQQSEFFFGKTICVFRSIKLMPNAPSN